MQNVENGMVWGNQVLLKVTVNSTTRYSAYKFLLAFCSNYVSVLHHF